MPFTRGGVTYPTQYAYRQALAARRGFATPARMVAATKAAQQRLAPVLRTLPPEQRGRVAAELASYLQQQPGALGPYVQGRPQSNRLPPDLLNYLRSLGNAQYPLWRLLYR